MFEFQTDRKTDEQTMMYSSNIQTQRATETALFNVISQRKPTVVGTFDRLTFLANNVQREVPPQHMPHPLLQQIEIMKAAVSSRWNITQRRYKRDIDKNVRQERTFNTMDYGFGDRPQLSTTAPDAADQMESRQIQQTSTPSALTEGISQRPTAYRSFRRRQYF